MLAFAVVIRVGCTYTAMRWKAEHYVCVRYTRGCVRPTLPKFAFAVLSWKTLCPCPTIAGHASQGAGLWRIFGNTSASPVKLFQIQISRPSQSNGYIVLLQRIPQS
jgi:hypothetical protein